MSLPARRREVTAVISSAWLKADRENGAQSIWQCSRAGFQFSNTRAGESADPIPKAERFHWPPSLLSMCVSSQAHSKCIQITSERSSIRSEIQYIYILRVDSLCSLWKITINSLIPTGGRLDLRAGISLSLLFSIYCTNLRNEVKCQTNESKPPDEDYILITSGD